MTDGAPSDSEPDASPTGDDPAPPVDHVVDLLRDEIDDAGAVGFVAVGADTPDVRYLSGSATVGDRAVVLTPTDVALSLPPTTPFDGGDPVESPLPVARRTGDTPVGRHAAALLSDLLGGDADDPTGRDDAADPGEVGGTVLVPRDLPHDAALYLDRAGYDLASTPALATARASKTPGERDRLCEAQRVAAGGLGRVASKVDPDDDDRADLDTDSLRTAVRTALAAAGAVGVDRVALSPTDASESTEPLDPRRPLVVELAPRLPSGYHARFVRTLVADSRGGWERRAHVAVTSALRVAAGELEPGVDADAVRREAVAELGSFGFTPSTGTGGDGATTGDGPDTTDTDADVGTDAVADVYGVGLAAREPPLPERGESVPAGAVVAVDAAVRDAEEGAVRVADLLVVGEDETTTLVDLPRSLNPTVYRDFDP
ncbi:M24 family metallopeptidase [Halobium salinum]|uniref:M24 family metallopeptidase n=1 Tax=Halobium salinum TaxID=1364940 RepID=A0ABD5PC01_9EURY|nr:M24 family metallopeptidase [Halobium salinum]